MGKVDHFARLFEFEDVGQVLITRDHNDEDDPVITTRVKVNGMICTAAVAFQGMLAEQQCADRFRNLTEAEVRTSALAIQAMSGGFVTRTAANG